MKITVAKRLFLVGSVVALGATYIAASAAPGHPASYNNASRSSEVTRTISITPSGGTGSSSTNLAFSDLLPGSPQTVTLKYQNTGTSSEDVYVIFPNATSLSALDNLGRFAQVHLTSTGTGSLGDVFDSSYLNDSPSQCGHFSSSGCWPLRNEYEIARNISPSTTGSFSFGFGFASAYSTQAPVGTTAYWNAYPLTGQTTIIPSDGSGAGLPYELVATQPGITPGQAETITQVEPFGTHLQVHDTGGDFRDQLVVSGASGAVSFVVTSTNNYLHVTTAGAVTTVGDRLAAGTYAVSGTDSDTSGDVGTWSYTLVVTGSSISCTRSDSGGVRRSNSGHFDDRLRNCDPWTEPHYTTTRFDDHLRVSDDGVVTEVGGSLPAGSYTVSGDDHDSYGDTGTWSFTLTVSR